MKRVVAIVALVALAAQADPPRYRGGFERYRVLKRSSVSAPAGISEGLKAWWSGTSLSASNWADLSGNGKPLTLGASTAAPTQTSRAWEFNGYPAAHLYATDSEYAEAATASDWTFLTTNVGSSGFVQFVLQQGAGGILLSNFGNSFAIGTGIGIWISTQQLSFYLSNGSGAVAFYVSGATAIPYGTITTLVWRLNTTTNKLEIRINGVQVNNSNAANYSAVAPTDKLRVGSYSSSVGTTFFGGMVSDLALWNRTLTDAEVTALEAWGNRTATPAFATDTTVLSPALGPFTDGGVVKVMFIGDSITEGITGASTLVGGYRHRVYDLSCGADAGVPIDGIGPYVGTLTPNGYPDNQSNSVGGAIIKTNASGQRGHATGSASCVAAPGGCINTIIGSGNSYHPDVIAVMLGINSITGIAEADIYRENNSTTWCNFIADMHQREPDARFVLMSLLPKIPQINQVPAFNRAEMACANSLRAGGVQLVTANTYAPLFSLSSLDAGLHDGLHPNDVGYELIGDVVCPAIRRAAGYPAGVLPDGGTP